MPSYGGKRGHPVGFPASLGAALLAAPPESTLKLALAATGVAHVEIAVDDPGVLRDVDVPSDL
jgi:molybdenum cofactor cytidylyltransferase